MLQPAYLHRAACHMMPFSGAFKQTYLPISKWWVFRRRVAAVVVSEEIIQVPHIPSVEISRNGPVAVSVIILRRRSLVNHHRCAVVGYLEDVEEKK